eukprot:XP_011519198.1 uncharacterized protein LOC105369669 [Homo sapiens]
MLRLRRPGETRDTLRFPLSQLRKVAYAKRVASCSATWRRAWSWQAGSGGHAGMKGQITCRSPSCRESPAPSSVMPITNNPIAAGRKAPLFLFADVSFLSTFSYSIKTSRLQYYLISLGLLRFLFSMLHCCGKSGTLNGGTG